MAFFPLISAWEIDWAGQCIRACFFENAETVFRVFDSGGGFKSVGSENGFHAAFGDALECSEDAVAFLFGFGLGDGFGAVGEDCGGDFGVGGALGRG
jgi:hypothetical protein